MYNDTKYVFLIYKTGPAVKYIHYIICANMDHRPHAPDKTYVCTQLRGWVCNVCVCVCG